jgi:hypothetical protein
MENKQHIVIPLLRTFDILKATAFYIDWLGFTIDREHRYAKDYRCMKPGLQNVPWNALTMEVIDPFGNKLVFAEDLKK